MDKEQSSQPLKFHSTGEEHRLKIPHTCLFRTVIVLLYSKTIAKHINSVKAIGIVNLASMTRNYAERGVCCVADLGERPDAKTVLSD